MGKRSLYSRVSRRLRHIADGDEVRGLGKRSVANDDAGRAPLLRYLQPAAAVAGALALLILLGWLASTLAG